MLIIPELETVVIMPPRTGTTALKNAVLRRWPESFLPYRHMEADGVPHGYDHWRRVGVVRDPLDRMWSLYRYLQTFGITSARRHDPAYTAAMRRSVELPFSGWLVNNELVFTSPYDRSGRGKFHPRYACLHPMPENRKSQFVHLRPDLGTEVVPYERIRELAEQLDVGMARENASEGDDRRFLSPEAGEYAQRVFEWDYRVREEML